MWHLTRTNFMISADFTCELLRGLIYCMSLCMMAQILGGSSPSGPMKLTPLYLFICLLINTESTSCSYRLIDVVHGAIWSLQVPFKCLHEKCIGLLLYIQHHNHKYYVWFIRFSRCGACRPLHLTVRVQLSQQTLRVPLISTFLPTSSRQWSIRLDQNLKV